MCAGVRGCARVCRLTARVFGHVFLGKTRPSTGLSATPGPTNPEAGPGAPVVSLFQVQRPSNTPENQHVLTIPGCQKTCVRGDGCDS